MAETFGCTPASVTIIPENECPARTVGPSCRASTRTAEATASGSVVRGFCTDVTLSPAACNRGITSDQHDPSAKRPCTRTTFLALGAGCARAAPTRSELAAAATVVLTKVRRSMEILLLYLRAPWRRDSVASSDKPVMLPPGRGRLAALENTMGGRTS